MNKPSVDPAFTFGVSLFVSLLLWFPTARETLGGQLDITDAGIRYCLALAISWAGVYGVSALVAMYASSPRKPATPPPVAEHPQRRREDAPADAKDENSQAASAA